VGISVLRIVRRAAQILTNFGCQVKLLELLLEHGAVAIHNFLLHTQFEVEPMAGIAQGNSPKAPRNQRLNHHRCIDNKGFPALCQG
jgi:hypothetical protein